VCRLLRDAAELHADAQYLRARAAADDNVDLLRTAAQLSAGARQAERDAWQLATLEAQARPKATPAWVELFHPTQAPAVSTAPEREQRTTDPEAFTVVEPEPTPEPSAPITPAPTPEPERPRFQFKFRTIKDTSTP
jgi:hypothetical protein